jgi:hypothetical protein
VQTLDTFETFEASKQPADAALNSLMMRSRASQALARAHLTEKKQPIASSTLDALAPKLLNTMEATKTMSAPQLEAVAAKLVKDANS